MEKTAHSEELNEEGTNYSSDGYAKACNTVDVCVCRVTDSLEVLMIKRAYPPFRDHWALPGGFVDIGNNEGLENAAIRELEEETGLSGLPIFQLKTYGDAERDPRDRIISTVYYTIPSKSTSENIQVRPQDDEVKEFAWINIKNLPENIAFDHANILNDLENELRTNIENYSFDFLDNEFTFTEAQHLHEVILDKRFTAPNFRRKLKSKFLLEHTGRYTKTKGRSSQLLVYRGKKNVF